MTLRTMLAEATARLVGAGVPSPRSDAEVLAAHALNVARGALLLQPDPSAADEAAYVELITRRASREPLQHITGEAYFRHLTLRVGPGVFVPRPETELVAGVAIDAAREVGGRPPIVVDLFAGSGAIALSVATEVSGAIVHAVEADDDAIGWLERNVAGLASSVTAYHADVAGCADGALHSLQGRVDVVVANPPYVPHDAHIRDPEVVAHDPAAALWSGADGLDAMRALEQEAARLLRPGGLVIAEHADVQGESAPAVFTATGRWTGVGDHTDLAGRPRYLTALLA